MPSVVASLVATLGLDVSKFIKGASDAQRAMKQAAEDAAKSGKKFSIMSADVQKAATALGVLGTAGVAFMRSAGRAASDLGEAINASGLMFGDAAESMNGFFESAADNLGMSERAARESSVQIAALIGNMGFAEQETADWSKTLLTLAADLGSAFNKAPEQAVISLAAAIRGETEPIRQFGVMLDDQAVRAKAVEMGLAATTKEVDRNGKAQATLALIMEQTSKIQGDFANTSDGLANATRVQAARWEDLQAQLGQAALPIMEKLTTVMSGALDVLTKLDEATGGFVGNLILVGSLGGVAFSAIVKAKAAWVLYAAAAKKAGAANITFMATMGPIVAVFIAVTIAIAGAITVVKKLGEAKARAKQRADELRTSLMALETGTGNVATAFSDAVVGLDVWKDATHELAILQGEGIDVMSNLMEVAGSGSNAFQDLGDAGFNMAKEWDKLRSKGDELNQIFVHGTRELTKEEEATRKGINALAEYQVTLAGLGHSEEEQLVMLQRMSNLYDEVTDATDKVTPSIEKMTRENFVAADAAGKINRTLRHNMEVLLGSAETAFDYAEANRFMTQAIREAEAAERAKEIAGEGATEETLNAVQAELLRAEALEEEKLRIEGVITALDALASAEAARVNKGIAARRAQRQLRKATDDVAAAVKEHGAGSDEAAEALDRQVEAGLRVTATNYDLATSQVDVADTAERNRQGILAAQESYILLRDTLGPANEATIAAKDALDRLAGDYEITLHTNVTGPLKGLVGGAVRVDDSVIDLLRVPDRHAGGIVPGLPGQEVPIIARGGEVVVSNSGNMANEAAALGGGGEVNITVTGGMDPAEVAFALAFEMENGVMV